MKKRQEQQARAAILAAMTRKAISGDTTAAKIILDAQQATTAGGIDIEDLTPLAELLRGDSNGGQETESNSR